MMNNVPSGRKTQGVRGQPPVQKAGYPPNQVLGMALGSVALISYSDESGKVHENMVFFFDGKAYMDDKNGEQWLREKLHPCKPWLAGPLEERYQQLLGGGAEPSGAEPAIPAASAVDVAPKPSNGVVSTPSIVGTIVTGPKVPVE
jgi:hypothetical protein